MGRDLLPKAIEDLGRNGRWGTCSGCTWTDPAQCEFTDRYDHKLEAKSLAEQVARRIAESSTLRTQAMQGYRLAEAVLDHSDYSATKKARRLLDTHKGIGISDPGAPKPCPTEP